MSPTPASELRTGSGDPLLLLHPFALSHHVWEAVAERLADSYDVYAPTMLGHWGGTTPTSGRKVSLAALADDIEAKLDALGWRTCHVVGNSLGGWVALELERRGRARSVTALAPAGGWRNLSRTEFRIGLTFLALLPFVVAGNLLGDLAAKRRWIQRAALKIVSHETAAVPRETAANYVRATTHCRVYLWMLWAGLRDGGITGLDRVSAPSTLLLCRKDALLPHPSFSRMFLEELPGHTTREWIPDVGHAPMLERPDLVAEVLRRTLARHQGEIRHRKGTTS
ncbi:alpha/beta fold hydrolase [Streptomyces noursei]|uniref:alpha/beta fold hydrolase n=1 Tax=Streptomyces noursei TaxID=1971 RepID=UPI0019646806|nr:alpha/beta hydrolase [Streptomyces noursei]QRX89966.1 alpha/beta hydrolase [Streptomyces noursei]